VLLLLFLLGRSFFSAKTMPFSWHRLWVFLPGAVGVACPYLFRVFAQDDNSGSITAMPLLIATVSPLIISTLRVRGRLLSTLLVLVGAMLTVGIALSIMEPSVLASLWQILMISAMYGAVMGVHAVILCVVMHYRYTRKRLVIAYVLGSVLPTFFLIVLLMWEAPKNFVMWVSVLFLLAPLPLTMLIALNSWVRAIMTGELFLKSERVEVPTAEPES
ncbi:MAG TPA: hypothetical protein PKH07_08660, partial [bacterium]|nr:hypothetical protein [bacterium]